MRKGIPDNRLTGEVSNKTGNCLLRKPVDCDENSFSGLILSILQMLTLCNYLNIHKTCFSGEVPEWIGETKNLESLDLSRPMPTSLGRLQFLKSLDLSMNSFSGSLPKSVINYNSSTGILPSQLFKLRLQKVVF